MLFCKKGANLDLIFTDSIKFTQYLVDYSFLFVGLQSLLCKHQSFNTVDNSKV